MFKVPDRLQRWWKVLDGFVERTSDKINPYKPEKLQVSDLKPVVIQENSIKVVTLRIMLVLSGLFLLWSTVAPMDAGVHITGKVMVSGKRKSVAHPSGGVVQEIMVKEGDEVKQGQVLLKINPLNTEANLNDAELEYINSLASESRLLAERTDASAIQWSPELLALVQNDPRAKQAQAVQLEVFDSGREARAKERQILQERIANLKNQLSEFRTVLALKKEQMETLSEEARSSRQLATEGYVSLATANEVERQRNGLLASISQSVGQVADVQSQISSGMLELVQRRSQFEQETNEKLTEVQKIKRSSWSKVESLRFDRNLSEVKAPVSGVVVGLNANTVGGVVKGAELLMEIVPEETELIVEAQVPPILIDKVRKGMEANLRFTAFNLRSTPVVSGGVTLVGADLIKGLKPDEEYYLALVRTSSDGMLKLEGLDVQPGMPVDVIVKNGERTFMSYLLKPLIDSVALSFKD